MRIISLFVVVFLGVLSACSSDEDVSSEKPDQPKPEAKKEFAKQVPSKQTPLTPPEAKQPTTGSVHGIVKFEGKKVPPKGLETVMDPLCAQYYKENGKPMPTVQRWQWGRNDTLQNVFVYVSDGLPPEGTYLPPKEPVEMLQQGCMYVPHVTAFQLGQKMVVRNVDKTLHNVHPLPRNNKAFGVSQPVPDMEFDLSQMLTKPEIGVFVKCDVHPWMSAYIHVMKHSFHAVTGKDGTFEIKGLPPGDYELTAWHEFRRFEADRNPVKVTIEGGATEKVTITYSPVNN